MDEFVSLARDPLIDPAKPDGAQPQASFDEFFAAEFERLVRFAYAMTRSDAEAQDVAQEAFASLFERWESVSNPSGFVRTVAVNRIRDNSRHLQVRRTLHATS